MRELARAGCTPRRTPHRATGAAARRAPPACALALTLALGGCYTFAPATPAAVPAGARVRVALTNTGAAALAPVVGSSVTAIEGDLVRGNADTLVVRADKLLTIARVDVAWTGRELALPVAWQRGLDRRRLAPGRTSLLAAGGLALSVAIVALVRSAGDRGGDAGSGGEPIRVFRGTP